MTGRKKSRWLYRLFFLKMTVSLRLTVKRTDSFQTFRNFPAITISVSTGVVIS